MPMWGYGARHDRLSEGVLDRFMAKALVIEAGIEEAGHRRAGPGPGPTPAMMERIRAGVAPRGIAQVLVCGSHTHHGPVIELTDQPGFGKGKFDDAVAYARELPDRIVAAILEADGKPPAGTNRRGVARSSTEPEPAHEAARTAHRSPAHRDPIRRREAERRSPSWSITRPIRS